MSGKARMEERLRQIGSPNGETQGNTMIEKWDHKLRKFSNLIEEDYKENRESREEFLKKIEILKEVEQYLAENIFNKTIEGVLYKLKAVVPFGSSASGLGMKGGDLDMIVCVHPAVGRKNKRLIHERSNDILRVIFEHIEKEDMLTDRDVTEMEHIDRANVPIITGYIDGVQIDISISMGYVVSAQYLAAKFVDAYEKYDRRFILLAAFVKKWHKSMKNDQNEDYHRQVCPNSCSTVLFVVLFMKHYGLLPDINRIHKDKLGEHNITWNMVKQGENGAFGISKKDVLEYSNTSSYDVNLGTLFLLFLDFYSNVVDLRMERLVIGDGVVRLKKRCINKNRVIVSDVLDGDNPAKSVIEVGEYQSILRQAIASIKSLDGAKLLKAELLSHTLVKPPMTNKRLDRLRQLGIFSRKR